MLLVRNNKPETVKFHIFAQQGVSTYNKTRRILAAKRLLHPAFFRGAERAAQQCAFNAERRKQRGEIGIVLLCQYLRGRHYCALISRRCRRIRRSRRNSGLSAAHVAAQNAAHGLIFCHIVHYLADGAFLRPRQLIRHTGNKRENIRFYHRRAA